MEGEYWYYAVHGWELLRCKLWKYLGLRIDRPGKVVYNVTNSNVAHGSATTMKIVSEKANPLRGGGAKLRGLRALGQDGRVADAR